MRWPWRPSSRENTSTVRSRLARSAAKSREMADAAKAKGVHTLVGYNYVQHPIHAITRSLIESGELGDLVSVRLANSADFLAAAEAPFVWRCDREAAGGGAVGDLAVHL
jgi:predicted dehydrogenase